MYVYIHMHTYIYRRASIKSTPPSISFRKFLPKFFCAIFPNWTECFHCKVFDETFISCCPQVVPKFEVKLV